MSVHTLFVAGVDEAGRGPLAGDVFAAAVILDPDNPIDGLMDSKKLSERKRNELSDQIKERSLSWSIASASVEEIDRINILHASMLAMKRAAEGLSVKPVEVLVDGNRLPKWNFKARAIVKGDSLEPCISAASILAKVARDAQMVELDRQYPVYGLAKHKGYPTKQHLELIRAHGVCDIYRRSFKPVAALL